MLPFAQSFFIDSAKDAILFRQILALNLPSFSCKFKLLFFIVNPNPPVFIADVIPRQSHHTLDVVEGGVARIAEDDDITTLHFAGFDNLGAQHGQPHAIGVFAGEDEITGVKRRLHRAGRNAVWFVKKGTQKPDNEQNPEHAAEKFDKFFQRIDRFFHPVQLAAGEFHPSFQRFADVGEQGEVFLFDAASFRLLQPHVVVLTVGGIGAAAFQALQQAFAFTGKGEGIDHVEHQTHRHGDGEDEFKVGHEGFKEMIQFHGYDLPSRKGKGSICQRNRHSTNSGQNR